MANVTALTSPAPSSVVTTTTVRQIVYTTTSTDWVHRKHGNLYGWDWIVLIVVLFVFVCVLLVPCALLDMDNRSVWSSETDYERGYRDAVERDAERRAHKAYHYAFQKDSASHREEIQPYEAPPTPRYRR